VIDRSPAWESADPNGCYGNAPSYGWLRKKRTGQIASREVCCARNWPCLAAGIHALLLR